MSASHKPQDWPDYISLPRDGLVALGVISLVYNRLEGSFGAIFCAANRIGHEQATPIFAKTQNDVRAAIVQQAMEWKEWPAELRDDVTYFLKAFDICAKNRHNLIHSMGYGVRTAPASPPVLNHFIKATRQGSELSSAVPTEMLRATADSMRVFEYFGYRVASNLSLCWRRRAAGEEFVLGRDEPFLERPALPTELGWKRLIRYRARKRPPRS